ncbi:hypothetical protein Acr_00g0024020 [Actinidia rufa]|uniref:Uncharacterized protein n=1 Tax=Actinidia rufa TaxID=165716 RepID=A0A7J0DEA7_9ERIC|nr:hypothetical protein Acr_00g0024020 [Actinidia rufa]
MYSLRARLQLNAHLHALTVMSDYRGPLPLAQASSAVIVLSSLNRGTSEVSELALVAVASGDLHPSKMMPTSCLSSVWVYQSAINVRAMFLSLARLRARPSASTVVSHLILGLIWVGTHGCAVATFLNLLLVHDDRAMEKFRATHGITTDVTIEHLRNSELGMTTFGHSRGTTDVCLIISTSPNAVSTNARRSFELPITGRSVVEPEDPALPISISSSNNEHLNDLAHAPPQSVREVEAIGLSSGEANIMRFRNLKKATPATDPLVVPNDFATFYEETSKTMKSLLVIQHVQLSKSDGDLRLHGRALGRAEEGQALSGRWDKYSRQVVEVRFESLLEGWRPCLAELSILEDNLAWNKAALAPKFLESLTPYSPMILPGFDEDEYMNRPDEDEDISEPILARDMAPTNEAANLAEEARKTIAEVYGERSVEETRRDDGEDASRDPPPEL